MTSWRREKSYLKFLHQKSDNAMRAINRFKTEVAKLEQEKQAIRQQIKLLLQQIKFYQREGQISYQMLLENRRKIAVILYQVKMLHQQVEELENRQVLINEDIKKSNLVVKALNKKSYKFELMLKQKRLERSLMLELNNENEIQEMAIHG